MFHPPLTEPLTGAQTSLLIGLFLREITPGQEGEVYYESNFKMLLGSKMTPTRAFCSREEIILVRFPPSSTEPAHLSHFSPVM